MECLSLGPFLNRRKSKNPNQDRHFRASTLRSRRGAVNDLGYGES